MSKQRSHNKFWHEVGKALIPTTSAIDVAVFVTARINEKEISLMTYMTFTAISIIMLVISYNLLSEPSTPPSGKWKRIKVKKDTTIHIQEQED